MIADISIQKAILALKNNPEIRLVDVRSAEEYKQGHIKGSINIPVSDINFITKQIPNRSTTIFVCCKTGSRATQAKQTLTAMGYTNVINIGSINGWKLTM